MREGWETLPEKGETVESFLARTEATGQPTSVRRAAWLAGMTVGGAVETLEMHAKEQRDA